MTAASSEPNAITWKPHQRVFEAERSATLADVSWLRAALAQRLAELRL